MSWTRIGADRGFAGLVGRISVQPVGTFVAKVAPSSPPDNALRAEIAFYRDVAPALPAPAPGCRFAGSVDGVDLLVLDEVADADPGDALLEAPVGDVGAVIDALRPMWATGYRCAPRLPRWADGSTAIARQERYAAQWRRVRPSVVDALPGEVTRLGDALPDQLAEVARALAAEPATVAHGDLHLDNVLFRSRSDGRRTAVVLDWATARLAPLALDIAPFVATSLSTPDRRKYGDALLGRLHSSLAAEGCPVGSPVAFADACRRALLLRFAGVVGWLARPVAAEHPRATALRQAALGDGRLVAALLDTEAGSVLSYRSRTDELKG